VDLSILVSDLLGLSALILSIINGLMLLRQYLRDRPIVTVKPIHPDVYQWWFRLPDGELGGMPTRRYGFLLYADIANRGLRKVALESWRLFIKTHARRSRDELAPISIPEPVLKAETFTKVFPVLGQKGVAFEGETIVDSGCSIAGWAYYVAQYYGHEAWNPIIRNDRITGTFVVRHVFGGKATTQIGFTRRELEDIEELVPGIATIPTS
jgi:hypothetical protein